MRVAAPVTPAQKLAGLIGLLLVLIGAFGFIGGSDFGAGDDIVRGRFLGLAVNGWTNLAHLLLGLLLLAGAGNRSVTRAIWRLTALVYFVVVLYGFIDGRDVFELFPLNDVAHVFDCVMWAIAFAGARLARETRSIVEQDRLVTEPSATPPVVGPGSGHVGGPRRFAARIDSQL